MHLPFSVILLVICCYFLLTTANVFIFIIFTLLWAQCLKSGWKSIRELLWEQRPAAPQCTPETSKNTAAATLSAQCSRYQPGKHREYSFSWFKLMRLEYFHTASSACFLYLIIESLSPRVINTWCDHRSQQLLELFQLNSRFFSFIPTCFLWPAGLWSHSWTGEWISQELQMLWSQFLCRTGTTSWITAETAAKQENATVSINWTDCQVEKKDLEAFTFMTPFHFIQKIHKDRVSLSGSKQRVKQLEMKTIM